MINNDDQKNEPRLTNLENHTTDKNESKSDSISSAESNPKSNPNSNPINSQNIKNKNRFVFLKMLSVFTVLLIAGLFWVVKTQTGTQVLLSGLTNVAGGYLYINGVEGNLASPMHINEIRLSSTTSTITIKNINLDWQLSTLWSRKLKIKALEISSLKVVSIPNDAKLSFPLNLDLPIDIEIKQAAIGKVFINSLVPNKGEVPQLYLSGVLASYNGNHAQHQLKMSTQSEWGAIELDSIVLNQAPFAINGNFIYQSNSSTKFNTGTNQAIPDFVAKGKVQGNLRDLTLQALVSPVQNGLAHVVAKIKAENNQAANNKAENNQAENNQAANNKANPKQADINKTEEKKLTQGEISLHLQVFKSQILQSAKVHLKNFNPLSIHKNAPNAQLTVDIELENKGIEAINFVGDIDIQNAIPMSIDKNGLPLSKLTAKVALSDQHLELKQVKLNVGNGSVKGNLHAQWQGKKLGTITSALTLSDINLLNIDSRLRKTSITGSIEANNKTAQQIHIKANLTEANAHLEMASNLLLDAQGKPLKWSLDEFNLNSVNALNLSSLNGKGELSFEELEKFQFSGEVKQFDPSLWMVAPKGKMAGKIEIKGQIKPVLQLQLIVPDIQGNLENQPLLGNVNLFWQQDKSLEISSLNFQLADNKISAQGKLDSENDTLAVKIDAPNLATLSPIIKEKITGSLQMDASLKGKLNAPSGAVSLQANNLQVKANSYIGKLDANIKFGSAASSPIQGILNVYDLNSIATSILDKAESIDSIESINSSSSTDSTDTTNSANSANITKQSKNRHPVKTLLAEAIHLNINGQNNAHVIDGIIHFNPSRILNFQASGGVDIKAPELSWKGQINNVSMGKLFQLRQAMDVVLSQKKILLGNGLFDGEIGSLQLDRYEWSPGSTVTKGHASQLSVFTLLDLVKPQTPQTLISGNLKLNADWDLQFQDAVNGSVKISRESGDILIREADVSAQTIALGIDTLNAHLRFGGSINGTDAEQLHASIVASGSRLGQWDAELETQLRYAAGQWQISNESPLKGALQAKIPDLQWIGNQLNPDFAIKGKLNIDAKIEGSLGHPRYQAKLDGKELELAFASEGLLLQKGTLSAQLSDETIKLQQLKFSNAITFIPKHEKLRDLPWRGQSGDLVASGEVDLKKQAGEIIVQWDRFPLLQRKDRWLITTGQAKITQLDKTWSLVGKMKADGGYFELPKFPPPSISNDVIVTRGVKPGAQDVNDIQLTEENNRIKTRLDMTLDLGSNFVFVGRGLDTPLSGTLRLKSTENSPILASGTILAMGGEYEGYGQKLEIERGILNFQGAPSNPSLNIRALRKGLPVEAGVDITGSVAHPVVRLVSEPNVPDADKLSWLVLGRESEQISTNDASLLFSAAGAIFGGDGSRNITKEFVQSLGFDEFSIGSADNGGSSKLPSQTIAGATTVGSSSNDQVVKIGARIKPGIVFSVEKGIADASGALKLSWLLSRRVQIVGRYGTDSSFDAKYTFSFN